MGLFKKTCYTGILTAASFLGYVGATTTIVAPLPNDDAIWSSRSYLQGNIHQNTPTQDVCLKRVSLDKIRPELLQKEGDLALELCRGIWSGLAFRIQRAYLARKYQGAATATQLWTVDQLSNSTYEPGTQLTDHFEVLDKTPTETVLRAGDSPRNSGPRGSDGLLVISAVVDEDRREVVLGLKSCFFGSDQKVEGSQGPMPRWMEEMHRWYSRLLITAASWRVTR